MEICLYLVALQFSHNIATIKNLGDASKPLELDSYMSRQKRLENRIKHFQLCLAIASLRILSVDAMLPTDANQSLHLRAQEVSSSVPMHPNLTTKTYYDGAETIGRVGQVAILRRDILHQIKKIAHMQYLHEIEKLPEKEREEKRKIYKEGILNGYLNSSEIYSQVLDLHIRKLLFYNDYVVSRPKEQIKQQTEQLEKEFDSKYVPELEKQLNCKSYKELEEYFETEIQSDFSQEKRIFIQQTLGDLWMNYNLGEEDFAPTLSELKRYYDSHTSLYVEPASIIWQGMTVYYGSKRSKEDARRKIAHMGNAVLSVSPEEQEAMFSEVCKIDSEDPFAKNGGLRESSERGMLRSEKVEEVVFSEDLPVGSLSQIIEDQSSFTIIRVISRSPERLKSFSEVQEEVRDKLQSDRSEALKKKYEERLSERFSVEIYALTKEERERFFNSANRDECSATGRTIEN